MFASQRLRRRQRNQRFHLEALEDRTLLSVAAQLSGTTLAVSLTKGDVAAHTVRLQADVAHPTSQTDVLDAGKLVGTFNNSAFSLIVVNLGPGNTTVDLGNVLVPSRGIALNEGTGINTLLGPVAGASWTVTGANAGTIGSLISFVNVENLVGAGTTNTLTGPAGSVTWNLNASKQGSLTTTSSNPGSTINFQGFTTLVGGSSSNTLIGPNATNTWAITAANAGSVASTAFRNIINLVGGTGSDTFAFHDGGSLSGTIAGGGGNDTLDYSAYGSAIKVSLAKQLATGTDSFTGTATATGGFSQIDHLLGSTAVNTLTGPNLTTVWSLTGTDQGNLDAAGNTIHYTLSYAHFAHLTGGTSPDTFKFSGAALVTGSIDGGTGANNTLDYSGANYPTTNALNFTNFSSTANLSLNGPTAMTTSDGTVLRMVTADANEGHSVFADSMVSTGNFSTTFQFRMTNLGGIADEDGHVGADGLVFVLQNSSPANAAGGDASGGGSLGLDGTFTDSIGIAFDTWRNPEHGDSSSNELGIDWYGSVTHGSGNGATTNVSEAFDNGKKWTAWVTYDGTTLSVYASDTGIKPATPTLAQKLNVSRIVGSPFAFAGFTAATGAGWQNTDVLNWQFSSSTPLPSNPGVLVDFAGVTWPPRNATGIGMGFNNIANVVGSAGPNYLRDAGAWQITAANAGTVPGATFSSFQNLEGTSKPSTFTFSPGASLAGSLFTGDGDGTVNLAPGVSVGGSLQGGIGKNTLVGANQSNSWSITDSDTGTVAGIAFTRFAYLQGNAGTDTFALKSGGSVSGTVDGGLGGNWLDYSTYGAAVTVNLATGAATGVTSGVKNVQNVLGSSAGNKLTGSAPGNILVGGAGIDTIVGGTGRSILIGGGANDAITGGPNQDIIIGGGVNFGANEETALSAILAEWQRTDELSTQRISNIRAGVGPNAAYQLVWGTTVLDDGGKNALRGNPASLEGSLDWFFANLAVGHDTIADRTPGDIVN